MSNKQFECPRCYKRCGNAGALKTHMKTHKKPEPKSGSMLKWVVKRVKSERRGFWLWRSCDPKEEAGKTKAWSKRSRKFEAHQTKPKTPNSHPKEISAACNAKQASAKKAASGINGSARSASWRASKAIHTESIEALIHIFSKIIREGTNCILLWLCDL